MSRKRLFSMVCMFMLCLALPVWAQVADSTAEPPTLTVIPTVFETLTETPTQTPTATHTETPTETATLLPTETATAEPTLTSEPSLTPSLDVAATPTETQTVSLTPDATVTPTETQTATLTPTFTPLSLPTEPPLSLLLTDSFDTGTLYFWTLGAGWALIPSEGGLALSSVGNDEPATFVHDGLLDLAVQLRAQFVGGLFRLSLRQSAAGAYTLLLGEDGLLTLYRGAQVLTSAALPPAAPGQWRTLRFSVIGDTLRVQVDGVEVLAVQDTAPLPPGTFSFAGMGGAALLVDDVELWQSTAALLIESPSESSLLASTQYVYASEVNDTRRTTTNDASGSIGFANQGSAVGVEDNLDLEITNATHGDYACVTLRFGGTVSLTSGTIEVLSAQLLGGSQTPITQDMRLWVQVSPLALNCDDDVTWADVWSEENAVRGWYGIYIPYTGSVRTVRLLVSSAGGNLLRDPRQFLIDAVRLYGTLTPDGTVTPTATPTPVPTFTTLQFNESTGGRDIYYQAVMFWIVFFETSEDKSDSGSPVDTDISPRFSQFLFQDPYCRPGANPPSDNAAESPTTSWIIRHCNQDHRFMMSRTILNAFLNYERRGQPIWNYATTNNSSAVKPENRLWQVSDCKKNAAGKDFSTAKKTNQGPQWLYLYLNCLVTSTDVNVISLPFVQRVRRAYSVTIQPQIHAAIEDFYNLAQEDATDGAFSNLDVNFGGHSVIACVGGCYLSPASTPVYTYMSDQIPTNGVTFAKLASSITQEDVNYAYNQYIQLVSTYSPTYYSVLQPVLNYQYSPSGQLSGYLWTTRVYQQSQDMRHFPR